MYKNLEENTTVKKKNQKDRVYCHEDYAQEMYDAIMNGGVTTPKDMKVGQLCQAEVVSVINGKILVQAESSQAIYLDLMKESKFLLRHSIGTDIAPGIMIDVFIDDEKNGVYSGSMEKAYINKIREDMFATMKTNTSAYTGKITSINEGGFIVDVAGLNCFMPGSLAAANKITNFESMIGKEVKVMVETYLEASKMFVVSNKKYIQAILPTKIKELEFSKKYTGAITGVMSYGVFVEWDEIYTGLLHESEIVVTGSKPGTGDAIEFYLKEVREGNRLILTQKDPSGESYRFETFKKNWEGKLYEDAVVKEVKPFGIFLDMGDILGMMSPKEFRRTGAKPVEGEKLDVFVKSVDAHAKKMQLRSVEDK